MRPNQPTRVAYYQHYCEPTDPDTTYGERTKAQLEARGLLYGTHPIVYSSRAGHASFPGTLGSPEPGELDVKPCGAIKDGAFDRLTANGWMWFTWEDTMREPLRNAARQRWYGFGGGWGARHGVIPNLPNAGWGPLGPGDVMWDSKPPLPKKWVAEWLDADAHTPPGMSVRSHPRRTSDGQSPGQSDVRAGEYSGPDQRHDTAFRSAAAGRFRAARFFGVVRCIHLGTVHGNRDPVLLDRRAR